MQPHQHRHSLFVTSSGLVCRRPADEPERYNLLIKNNRTGQHTLNGCTVCAEVYNAIAERVWEQYPGSCIIANAFQVVFVYPKKQMPHTW